MVWNWSWDIKGNCSFKLIPFRNKLHKPWSARNISVSVRMQRDRSCNWNPGYLCKDGYCVCVCGGSPYINALQENRMNWTAREMELSRERVELSHMVSATAGRACQGWAQLECGQRGTVSGNRHALCQQGCGQEAAQWLTLVLIGGSTGCCIVSTEVD